MPRSKTNRDEFFAGVLPKIKFQDKEYFVDGRLKQLRNVEDFNDTLDESEDEVWEQLSQEAKDVIVYEYYGETFG